MEQSPVNYDFGKNWSCVAKFLDEDEIIEAVREGLRRYYGDDSYADRYLSDDVEAYWDMEKRHVNEIPKFKYYDGIITDCGGNDDNTWIGYWMIGRRCHWLNPTFTFTLAQLVCPDEDWYVLSGEFHTSIFNRSHTKCFDLGFWSFDNRLESLLYDGVELSADDPTMGGRRALDHCLKVREVA